MKPKPKPQPPKLDLLAPWPNDPQAVRLLLEEGKRMTRRGNAWLHAEVPNLIASDMCLRTGWAYALAAAWLRCKLKGEFEKSARSFPA